MAHGNIHCLEIIYSSSCMWLCGQRRAEIANTGGHFWCCHWFSGWQGINYNKLWIWYIYPICSIKHPVCLRNILNLWLFADNKIEALLSDSGVWNILLKAYVSKAMLQSKLISYKMTGVILLFLSVSSTRWRHQICCFCCKLPRFDVNFLLWWQMAI